MVFTTKDLYYLMFQELAAVLMGVLLGVLAAFYCPHIIPAFIRYPIGVIVGWVWLASVPMYFIRHRDFL